MVVEYNTAILFCIFLFLPQYQTKQRQTVVSVIKKQSFYYAIIAYIGVVLGAISTLIIQPSLFSAEIIGLLGTISDAAFLFVPFAKFGADAILIRYHVAIGNTVQSLSALLYFTLKRLLVSFVVFVGLFFLIAPYLKYLFLEKSALFVGYVYWVIPLGITLVFYAVLEAYTQIIQYTSPLVFVRELLLRIGLIILAVLYFYCYISLDRLVSLYVFMYAFCLFGLICFLYAKKQIGLSRQDIDKKSLANLWHYSLLITIGGICGIAVTKIDSLLIAKYLGLAENGIYRISFFMSVMVEIPGHSLKQLVAPLVAQHTQRQDYTALEQLYQRVSTNQLLIGIGIFVGIWLNIDSLFALMPNGGTYAAGKQVFFWVGMAKLIDLATGNNEEIIVYSEYYSWALGVGIVLVLLTFLTGILLIPIYGIVGAAWATSFSIVGYNIVKLLIVYIKIGILPFSRNTLLCLIIGLVSWVIVELSVYCLPVSDGILSILLKSFIFIVFYSVSSYAFCISDDINKVINAKLAREKH